MLCHSTRQLYTWPISSYGFKQCSCIQMRIVWRKIYGIELIFFISAWFIRFVEDEKMMIDLLHNIMLLTGRGTGSTKCIRSMLSLSIVHSASVLCFINPLPISLVHRIGMDFLPLMICSYGQSNFFVALMGLAESFLILM